ncbi:RNA polymerase sigma-70 factor [Olivibacter ginsenosidimutans]|uniref:RNA polymerase sigma-70 factor n=1 Tax=Olivibacter ginsenosidimutans TaxID=1176537 RepID=A0ABP9AVE3_9SPHI
MKKANEHDLVLQLQQGDSEAFTHIYRLYAHRLTAFASSKLNSLEEARDVIHDIFVQLWEQRMAMTPNKGLEPLLFTIARNRIVDHIRKNSTQESYAQRLKQLTVLYHSPDQLLEAKDVQQIIASAVDEMPKRVREIYQLSREEHLSIAEIAQKLQLSEQTVKNQLNTALNLLRKSIVIQSFSVLWLLDWLVS